MGKKILISHRGNINGRIEESENDPLYINDTLSMGYDVEIDVWYYKDSWFLGHDSPTYSIEFGFFEKNKDRLWIHAKNIQAVERLSVTKLHWFWHQKDTITLTSWGFIWAYPGNQPILNSIAVLPEIQNDKVDNCLGICSDHIASYLK